MKIENIIIEKTNEALVELYKIEEKQSVVLQKTKKEFIGDITIAVFPYTKLTKKAPEQLANELGTYLTRHIKEIKSFNVIKGFLNLEIDDSYWLNFFDLFHNLKNYGIAPLESEAFPIVLEFSSPNTNKPLHLGHIRNNLLGQSIAEILRASGKKVVKVNLVNDRGIHICKSMLAWMKYGNQETPQSNGLKGDHLVGKYYVEFDKVYKEQIKELIAKGLTEEDAKKEAPIIKEAQEMLVKWENRDAEVYSLWEKMNGWVYEGFDVTYKKLGIDFNKTYYESQTYLLGKTLVEEGLAKNVFFKKEDNSVWIDLTGDGLDQKLLLRSDGTSVYITQDLGTAQQRFEENLPQQMIYVVGNEQNYHFDVLKLILLKMGRCWAKNIHHLSYGMVELPEGKMKSREGTVVDADDLMDEMCETARKTTEELGKVEDFNSEEAQKLFNSIGMAALKYFILKVDPKKNMTFNPKESIDFNGNTGPFVQYTHARISSLLKKADSKVLQCNEFPDSLAQEEKDLLKLIHTFDEVINESANALNPSLIANYVYEVAKEYNRFYQALPILKETDVKISSFRLKLSMFVGNVIKTSLQMLGIEAPEKM